MAEATEVRPAWFARLTGYCEAKGCWELAIYQMQTTGPLRHLCLIHAADEVEKNARVPH